MLDDWITALTRELGLDGSVDEGLLLDVARDAAHNVARPAAPVTTFLVGLAEADGLAVVTGDGPAGASVEWLPWPWVR